VTFADFQANDSFLALTIIEIGKILIQSFFACFSDFSFLEDVSDSGQIDMLKLYQFILSGLETNGPKPKLANRNVDEI